MRVRSTSPDDPAAIIETMTCHQLAYLLYHIKRFWGPYGPGIRFSVSIFCMNILGLSI